MSFVRRFLLAPALSRLVRQQRDAALVTEGFLLSQQDRTCFLRVEGENCNLILDSIAVGGGWNEEPVPIRRGHADALLAACAGRTMFERSLIRLDEGRDAVVDHYIAPGALDLISVTFQTNEEGSDFAPPVWFGPEVSDDAAFEGHVLALDGMPSTVEVQPTNAALHGLLDKLEELKPTRTLSHHRSSGRLSAEDSRVLDALRRLSLSGALRPKSPTTPAAANDPPHVPPHESELESGMGNVISGLSHALGAATARAQDRAETGEEQTGAPASDLRHLPIQGSASGPRGG